MQSDFFLSDIAHSSANPHVHALINLEEFDEPTFSIIVSRFVEKTEEVVQ